MFELSVESIYNVYHRETFKAQRGFYPRNVKNFSSIDDNKRELLNRFVEFCKHNYKDVDPIQYIRACAEFYKYPFKLSILGSLNGNKIYKEYKVLHKNDVVKITDEDVSNALKMSLNTINEWHLQHQDNCIIDYFKEYVGLIPLFIIDMVEGRMSPYLVVCLSMKTVEHLINDIDPEAFLEYTKMSPRDFFNEKLKNARNILFKNEFRRTMFDKIFAKFSNANDK